MRPKTLARRRNRSPNTAIGAVPGMTADPPTPARNGFARRGAASVFVADVAKDAGQWLNRFFRCRGVPMVKKGYESEFSIIAAYVAASARVQHGVQLIDHGRPVRILGDPLREQRGL